MVGSLDTVLYTDDNNASWVVTVDKSNVLAVNGSPLPFPASTDTSLPKGTTPRYLLYRDISGKQTRKIIGLYPTTAPADYPATITGVGTTPEGAPSLSITFFKTFFHGERQSFSGFGEDTGIIGPDS